MHASISSSSRQTAKSSFIHNSSHNLHLDPLFTFIETVSFCLDEFIFLDRGFQTTDTTGHATASRGVSCLPTERLEKEKLVIHIIIIKR